ncbi:hypothetical protein AAKU55_003620 [Oxalobacteraceae bacterium GrIS 1.11]
MNINLGRDEFAPPAPAPLRRRAAPPPFAPRAPLAPPAQAPANVAAPRPKARPAPRPKAGQPLTRTSLAGLLAGARLPAEEGPRGERSGPLEQAEAAEPCDPDEQAGLETDAARAPATSADAALDDEQLEAGLHGLHEQQGIFELLLPDGQSIAVVVNNSPSKLSFLLSASDRALGQRLQEKKMELEQRLQRRIARNVEIAVL